MVEPMKQKKFNHKFVFGFEKPNNYAFSQRSHQCIYDRYWTKSNDEMLRCVVCRT